MKRKLFILLWVVLAVGVLALLFVVVTKHNSTLCSKVEINIDYSNGECFISVEDVNALISKTAGDVLKMSISEVNVLKIEQNIDANPYVSNSEVFLGVDGILKINIKQRKPICRVVNEKNMSFYIDADGKLMPVNSQYTARVVVANGKIPECYSGATNLNITDSLAIDTMLNKPTLQKIYLIARYIDSDEFWKSHIEQIFVNKYNDIELIPKIGDHIILVGNDLNIKEKLENLKIFYIKILNKVGWDKYKLINIKFKNQVVCSKTY